MLHGTPVSGQPLTWAFLACGCRSVYDSHDRDIGDVVVCPTSPLARATAVAGPRSPRHSPEP